MGPHCRRGLERVLPMTCWNSGRLRLWALSWAAATVLYASGALAEVFVVYSENPNDDKATQHLRAACSQLRETNSEDVIFFVDRRDPAVSFVKTLIQRENTDAGPSAPRAAADVCAGPILSDDASTVRNCLAERINLYWNDPSNSAFRPCFARSAPQVPALPLVVAGFAEAADRPNDLAFEMFDIDQSGRVRPGRASFFEIGRDIAGAGDVLKALLLGAPPTPSASSPPSPVAGRDSQPGGTPIASQVPSGAEDARHIPDVYLPWKTWTAAGAFVLSASAATVLAVDARSTWRSAQRQCNRVEPGLCAKGSAGPELSNKAMRFANWATGFSIAAAVSAGLGVYFYLQEGIVPTAGEDDASTAFSGLNAQVGFDSAEVSFSGTF